MRRFRHVGIITDQVQPGEIYVAATKVHVTNPADHPHRVEYLRFEPDSPVIGPVRDQPHMAFAVDDLEAEIAGERVLLGRYRATEGLRAAFVFRDGAVFEFNAIRGPVAVRRGVIGEGGRDGGPLRSAGVARPDRPGYGAVPARLGGDALGPGPDGR